MKKMLIILISIITNIEMLFFRSARRPFKLFANNEYARFKFYVISLKREKHRRKFIEKHFSNLKIEFEFFDAVDGLELNVETLICNGFYDVNLSMEKFSRKLSNAEIACSLSHLSIYRKMLDERINICLISEDDIIFPENINELLTESLGKLPPDWDLVYIYHISSYYDKLNEKIVRFSSNIEIPGGAVCYLINASGAAKLLAHAFPIHYPADSLIGRSHRWDTKLYGIIPSPVKLNMLFPSTLRKKSGIQANIEILIRRLVIFILNCFIACSCSLRQVLKVFKLVE